MANLRAKLLQKIEVMQKEVLYDIFLYIHKIYDTLDLGARPSSTRRVWGGPPGLPTPDLILVSGNDGGEG